MTASPSALKKIPGLYSFNSKPATPTCIKVSISDRDICFHGAVVSARILTNVFCPLTGLPRRRLRIRQHLSIPRKEPLFKPIEYLNLLGSQVNFLAQIDRQIEKVFLA